MVWTGHTLFMHSSVDRHWSVHILAAVNNAAVDMGVCLKTEVIPMSFLDDGMMPEGPGDEGESLAPIG